jgi:hypothetical protein
VRKLACALKAVASHRNPKFLLILFQMDMRIIKNAGMPRRLRRGGFID